MADITQRIVVKVDYDSNLKTGIQEVEQLGKVAKEDVAAFNALQKEINSGINDALKEAGVSMKDFASASQKATQQGAEGFKSLKQQLREARDEATALGSKFGESSKQAVDAQKKVAKLSDELGDFNNRVKALNPDAKFTSLNQVMQGTIVGFQGIIGAAQLFGAENKELNETLMKMQGLLNLTQGINSVLELKDVFANLRAVLGITVVAQESMAAATAAEGVAATEATAANYAFATSLSATGIGAIIVGLGLLVGAWMATKEATDDAAESAANYQRILDKQKIFNDVYSKESKKLQDRQKDSQDYALRMAQAQGASEREILTLKISQVQAQINLNRELQKSAQDQTFADKLNEENRNLIQDLDVLVAQVKHLEVAIRATSVTPLILKENIDQAKKDIQDLIDKQNELNHQIERPKKVFFPNVNEAIGQTSQEKLQAFNAKYLGGITTLATQSAGIFKDQVDSQYQYEEAALQDQLKRKEISQKQYDAKLRALKRKQAEDDKKFAIFNALIAISQAILVANASAAFPANIPAISFASAIGALQLAAIISRPIPKFAKGTLNVQGGLQGQDSVHAMLMPGEAVIPTHINRAYSKTIEAIYKGTVRPSDLNAFVDAQRNGRTGQSMAANMELIRAVRGNGQVGLRNASELAKMIGSEVANNLNIRRR